MWWNSIFFSPTDDKLDFVQVSELLLVDIYAF